MSLWRWHANTPESEREHSIPWPEYIEGAQALWLGAKKRITLCPYGGGMPTLQRVSESTLYPGLCIEGGIEGAQALWLGAKQRITLCPYGGALQRVSEGTLYPGLFMEYIEGAQALWLGAKQRITLCPFGTVASRTNSSVSVSKAECYFCHWPSIRYKLL